MQTMDAVYVLGIALLLLPVPSQSQVATMTRPRDYRIDAGHSLVEFSIPFLYGKVRGRFDDVRGTMLVDEADMRNSSLTVIVGVKSINSGSAHRDEHLRSEDFFDVTKYPTARFESHAIERAQSGFVASGAFTLHGVTREIRVPFHASHGPVADPHGSRIVGYTGTLRLARKEFGILGGDKHNEWFDAVRSATMGDTVDLTLELEGWSTDFQRVPDRNIMDGIARIDSAGIDAWLARNRQRLASSPPLYKDQEWGLMQLAYALMSRGRVHDARLLLSFATEALPGSASILTSLGDVLERDGDTSQALALYARSIAIDSGDTRASEFRRRLAR